MSFTGKFSKSYFNNIPSAYLNLLMCKKCKLVQLDRNFNLKYLYGKDYGYRTGINKTMTDHVKKTVKKCSTLVNLKAKDQVLDIINAILQDFFTLDKKAGSSLLGKAQNKWKNSTSIFEFGNQLNEGFSHDDKIDFISCVFEVAYADGELHYLEHHTIKKIANILNLHRDEIITAKAEIENFLDSFYI